MSKIFNLKIGGQAGQGVKSAGLLLAKMAARSGYFTYDFIEYPSLIRGGHNVMTVSISQEFVTAPAFQADLLVALNQETIKFHLNELVLGSSIIYDEKYLPDDLVIDKSFNLIPIPLGQLAAEAGGKELMINAVALGAVTALLGADIAILDGLLSEEFTDKGPEVVQMNQKAAQIGFDFITEHFAEKIKPVLIKLAGVIPKMVLNGNDAVALGAIAGGLQFASIYPMSPISNILHLLALHQEKYGFVYTQPEDEIAAVNMAIGASFAGARAMTATSGGGFCLMSEGYGLAGMTETPLVIVDGMRPGPATGLPTWSDQGDLAFVLHAHQGDFPRIVLAAGDAKEAFELTMRAFNLADKYQTPVVLLIDKNICENEQSFPFFETSSYVVSRGNVTDQVTADYKRYVLADDGISLRSFPGTGNYFMANSYEHDEIGVTSEEVDNRNKQMRKRMVKLKTCVEQDLPKPELFGPKQADLTIVSWGSNKGAILEALKSFSNVNFLHLTWLNPFPEEEIRDILSRASYILDVECNFSGQLACLIREKVGIEVTDKLLKYDGRPFFPEEIIEEIKKVLKSPK